MTYLHCRVRATVFEKLGHIRDAAETPDKAFSVTHGRGCRAQKTGLLLL